MNRRAQVKRQHADKMHGPGAPAQRNRARTYGQLALPGLAYAGGHTGHLQGHGRGEDRNRKRQAHQPGAVKAI